MQQTKPMERLDEWLKTIKLPEMARLCIENFVLSCDEINPGDEYNFVNMDIRNFPDDVQGKLVTGFFYAYKGLKHIDYICCDGIFYQLSRN